MPPDAASKYVEVEGLRLHYLEQAAAEPVLLLHGWPTSSFLWRNLIGPIAEHNRAIAIDLPGFGRSDKPLDASYSFRYYDRVLNGFLDAIGIDATGLAVHDLGGPVGLYWASQNPERTRKLALLNTLVYARPSWAVIAFVAAARTPGVRSWLASPSGLARAMRIGVHDKSRLTDEVIRGVQEPFETKEARRALLKAGTGLHPGGFKESSAGCPRPTSPSGSCTANGTGSLPDVAKTMRRVASDVSAPPEITALPDCGHFLQEERPADVARILADFFR